MQNWISENAEAQSSEWSVGCAFFALWKNILNHLQKHPAKKHSLFRVSEGNFSIRKSVPDLIVEKISNKVAKGAFPVGISEGENIFGR